MPSLLPRACFLPKPPAAPPSPPALWSETPWSSAAPQFRPVRPSTGDPQEPCLGTMSHAPHLALDCAECAEQTLESNAERNPPCRTRPLTPPNQARPVDEGRPGDGGPEGREGDGGWMHRLHRAICHQRADQTRLPSGCILPREVGRRREEEHGRAYCPLLVPGEDFGRVCGKVAGRGSGVRLRRLWVEGCALGGEECVSREERKGGCHMHDREE